MKKLPNTRMVAIIIVLFIISTFTVAYTLEGPNDKEICCTFHYEAHNGNDLCPNCGKEHINFFEHGKIRKCDKCGLRVRTWGTTIELINAKPSEIGKESLTERNKRLSDRAEQIKRKNIIIEQPETDYEVEYNLKQHIGDY